jgi:site-specific DNA recombinase
MLEKINHKDLFYFYIRVSSEEQSEGASLDEQDRQIREYARRNSLNLATSPYKEVQSAKDNHRPIFNRMIEDLRKFKAKGFIVHKLDRLARNFKDAALTDDLIKENFEIHSVSDGINSNHPNWRLAAIQFGFAKYYLDNLKHEIHKGITGMVADGRSPMAPPLGYLATGRGNKEPDPVMAPLIKRTFEVFSAGDTSIEELHTKMTKVGLMSKATLKRPVKPISSRGLYKILRNPFYYGLFRFKGELKLGSHKPIISKALFDKVQDVMDKGSYKHHRKFTYLFSGMLTCRVCGRPLRAISSHGRYRYYACRNLACKCNIREELVEEEFVKQLRDLEFDDQETAKFLKAVEQFRHDLKLHRETDIKNVDLELGKLHGEKNRLLDLCLDSTLSQEEYKKKSSDLTNRDKELCERRLALQKADSEILDHIAEIGKLLKKPTLSYREALSDGKRQLIKSLVENTQWVDEKDAKRIVFIWKNDFQPFANHARLNSGGPGGNRTPD